jgi:hypothetical protein
MQIYRTFFYVWLKRTLGEVFTDLFATPLTPKSEEICEMAGWDNQLGKQRAIFLVSVVDEILRTLTPRGGLPQVLGQPFIGGRIGH